LKIEPGSERDLDILFSLFLLISTNVHVSGDRILSVNGCSVERLSYADVVRLIQLTGECLEVVVVPKKDDILQTVSCAVPGKDISITTFRSFTDYDDLYLMNLVS